MELLKYLPKRRKHVHILSKGCPERATRLRRLNRGEKYPENIPVAQRFPEPHRVGLDVQTDQCLQYIANVERQWGQSSSATKITSL